MNKALIVIDIQNDYFSNGKYPLWNSENTLLKTIEAVNVAAEKSIPIILIKQVTDSENAPMFVKESEGVEIHSKLLESAPNAIIIEKKFADSFEQTSLGETLKSLNVEEIIVCGMMTQNCVTHTAISKAAENYKVSILSDCCTTVDRMIHAFALRALEIRVPLIKVADI